MRKNSFFISLILLTSMLVLPNTFAASAKAGVQCTKAGATSVVAGTKVKCVKTGKKLIWIPTGAGATPTASATPTPTPSASAIPTKNPTSSPRQKLLADFVKDAKSAIENSGNYLPTLDATLSVKINDVGSNALPHFIPANTSGKFAFLGPTPLVETDPSRAGAVSLITKDQHAVYGSQSALPPWGATFNFTTTDPQGRFVVETSGQSNQGRQNYSWRLAFKTASGLWKYQNIAGTPHAINSKVNFDQVTLGAPGNYSIHLEFDYSTIFYGIGLSDETIAIDQGAPVPTTRVVIVGDSWVYPVFNETGPVHVWDAFPGALSWLTGWNVISTGVPGQGYLASAAGEIYRDRVRRDIVPQNPDVVIFTGSPNDHCRTCTFTDQELANEMGEDIRFLKASNPNILVIVCSPFQGSPSQADAMKSVAESLGVAFINFNNPQLFDSINNSQGQLANGHPTRLGSAFIAAQLLKLLSGIKV